MEAGRDDMSAACDHCYAEAFVARRHGDSVREILLFPVVAEVRKGQDDDRQAWRSDGRRARRAGRHAPRRRAGYAVRVQRIDPHRPRDVLDALLTHILEGVREPVADMVTDGARDADAAWRRQPLQARCVL